MNLIPERLSAIFVLLLSGFASSSPARVWHVPADAPTIQAGVDSSSHGDTILVACGTYKEHDIVLKPGITLFSESGAPDCVVIDARRRSRVLNGDDLGNAVIVQGMTFRGGLAPSDPFAVGGGGRFHESSPQFIDCDFVKNTAELGGGGLAFDGFSRPILTRCRFIGNRAGRAGGGLDFLGWSIVITDCHFEDNAVMEHDNAQGGGAALVGFGDWVVDGTRFVRNRSASRGGGLYLDSSSRTTIAYCHFAGNRAEYGAGLYINCYDEADIRECSISRNNASDLGGGAYVRLFYSSQEFTNTSVWNNAAPTGRDGYLENDANHFLRLVCCDVAIENWSGDSNIELDDSACSVGQVETTWGSVKAMYR